jgi:rubrerythrin
MIVKILGRINKKMKLVYRWYCHNCDGEFYVECEEKPEFCPFCKDIELENKKTFEIKAYKP